VQLRTLGRRGPTVSRLALGAMTFGAEADEATSHALLDTFVAAEGNLVDTADVYSDGASERIIGRWLAARPGIRERIVLATKGRFPVTGQPGSSLRKGYLHTAVRASLKRLGVDHVDLYQAHGPDPDTPLDELAEFFDEAVRAGLIGAAGVSNLPGWQIAKLAQLCRERGDLLISHQPQYSLLVRETEWEIMPAAIDSGLGALVWGPMAAGWLTGKYQRSAPPPAGSRLGDDPHRGLEAWDRRGTDRTWSIVEALREEADRSDLPMAQLALAWVADRPGVSAAIVGARSPEQLESSLGAADLTLDEATRRRLDAVSEPPIPDYPYAYLRELNP
jgi:aryl-alcohol dehydrogenase-like predicted oxidoreductase